MSSGIFYPAANADDGVRKGATEFYTYYSSSLLGSDSGDPWKFFTRFVDINIPSGSTITNAFIRLESYETISTSTCNEEFSFNDVDNAEGYNTVGVAKEFG